MSITSLQVGAKFMISTGDQFYQSNNAGTYKTAYEGVVNLTDARYTIIVVEFHGNVVLCI